MSKSIEELAQKRQRWIDANKENGFEEGIKKLLTELYPDNAHFIYELLQNAEDPGASVVRFSLSGNNIKFEHNGKRLFNIRDVESITSIGASTKRDDPTTIGKFGVGFKAVFAYTSTPEIHSGEFHFCIHDLVVPEKTGAKISVMGDMKTRFVFPFDHPAKRPSQAVEDIKRGLRALGDNTLLFLNNIRLIEYILPDGSLGSLNRINHENGQIEIHANHPTGEKSVSHWLRYQKDVKVTDENGKIKDCQIAIAYGLDKEDSRKNKQLPEWKIIPIDHGQVSIYFPAEKETSNLKFHVHAPFASTVARDSVRDCEANIQLRDHIAELIVESLIDVRDRGMLSMSFLAVLPNKKDNLSRFYEPIQDAIVQAFEEKEIVPTKNGKHKRSVSLYRGPAKISEVITDNDLSFLTGYDPPLWAANPPQQNQREDTFLEGLEIDLFSWGELVDKLLPPNKHYYMDVQKKEENSKHIQRVEGWLQEKNDTWVMRFYALLGEANDEHYKFFDAKNYRIVRVVNNEEQGHVMPCEAFFSPEQYVLSNSDVSFVKPEVYNSGRSESQKRYSRYFLEEIGVRNFDEKAIIELKLSSYDNNLKEIDDDTHHNDLMQFISYWKKDGSDIKIFKNHEFLKGTSENGELVWCTPNELCLDSPFKETGLGKLIGIHRRYAIWDGYKKIFKEEQINIFTEFLSNLGVMYRLKVQSVNTESNPNREYLWEDYRKYGVKRTNTGIDEDYNIRNIENYVSDRSVPASRLIWYALIGADSKVETARFRPNQQYGIRESESQLVNYLKKHAWIPDKEEIFRKPKDMTTDKLREDFPYDNSNGLLSAINFGENEKIIKKEYRQQNRYAQDLGFESAAEAEKMAKIAIIIRESGQSPDRFLEKILPLPNQKQAQFPSRSVVNPERRQGRLLEQFSEAPEKEYSQRVRNVRTTNGAIDPTTWLRIQYSNESDQMVCQICKKEMPFRKRDGKHYFVKKEVLSRKFLPKEHEAQYLALCPLCAAKYDEFVKTDDQIMVKLMHEIVNSDNCEISISLGDEKTSIRFVETHFHDLKAIIDQ